MRREILWTIACAALLVAVLGVIVATYGDYGLSWDERQQSDYGQRALAYYLSGGRDDSHARLLDNHLYGAFFSVLEAVAVRLFADRLGEIETSHLFTALFGWMGIVATAALGGLLAGPRAAFVSALLLVLIPTWYGHLFNNTKDIPFGTMYAVSLLALAWRLQPGARSLWPRTLLAGLAIGATMGIRIGGIILLAYLAGVLLVPGVAAWRRDEGGRALVEAVGHGAAASALAYAVMLASWPWAQQSPITHPLEALHRTAEFHHTDEVLYRGALHLTTDLPWDYVPGWLLIQTPEVMLIAAALGLGLSCAGLARLATRDADGATVARQLPLLGVVVPIVLFFVSRPVVYDAARHFLFVLPALAVLVALGLEALAARLSPRGRWGLAVLVGAGLTLPLHAMVAAHPYQYVYFNALVGGLRGAQGRYELDYWSTSFREATLGLRSHERLQPADEATAPRRVYVCGARHAATPYFPPHWELTSKVEAADFAIVLRRHACNRPFRDRRPLLTVERQGVAFAYVYDQGARRERKARR